MNIFPIKGIITILQSFFNINKQQFPLGGAVLLKSAGLPV